MMNIIQTNHRPIAYEFVLLLLLLLLVLLCCYYCCYCCYLSCSAATVATTVACYCCYLLLLSLLLFLATAVTRYTAATCYNTFSSAVAGKRLFPVHGQLTGAIDTTVRNSLPCHQILSDTVAIILVCC